MTFANTIITYSTRHSSAVMMMSMMMPQAATGPMDMMRM